MIDLHYINADVVCEVCELRMADVIRMEQDGRAHAYHLPCLEVHDEKTAEIQAPEKVGALPAD